MKNEEGSYGKAQIARTSLKYFNLLALQNLESRDMFMKGNLQTN